MAAGPSRAQRNRHVRQEALRDQLSAQGHVQHIVDIVDKIRDPEQKIDPDMVTRYRLAIDTKLKLLNKYLPDLKSTELTGEGGGEISIAAVERTIVDPKDSDS